MNINFTVLIFIFVFKVYDKQKEVAKDLLKRIKDKCSNLEKYKYFDLHIIVPKFKSLGISKIMHLKLDYIIIFIRKTNH